VESYQKELQGYPKHIGYYQARMDNISKNILGKLELNNQKAMRYIMFYEMYTSIKSLYARLLSLLQSITNFMDKNNDLLRDVFNPLQKRSFDDAMISIDTTKIEITIIEKDLVKLITFLHDPDAVN
jgi:aspartokinase